MSTSRCHFCSKSVAGAKTREHVFAKWLLRAIDKQSIKVDATHYSADATKVSVRSQTLDDLVLGGVCASCNNGWMSKLEERAKPVLTALMNGGRLVESLDAVERATLARWAIKTATALNLASDFEKLFPGAAVRALSLDALELPRGFHVFAGQHAHTNPSGWLQCRGIDFFLPEDDKFPSDARQRLSQQGARIGLQLKSICFCVAYWPHAELPLAIWPAVHEPLWPTGADYYPFKHHYDGEPDPRKVDSTLYLYRTIETLGAVTADTHSVRLAMPKGRAPHVSGPEPVGHGQFLPLPSVLTPAYDRRVREWLEDRRKEKQS